nr:uncharacterized protein LOC106680555 [Halyomorpha halys]
MRTLGLPVLTILATISSFSCLAAPLEQNNNFVEKPKAYFIPHVRAKREFGGMPSFSITGKGSNKSGFIKESIAGLVWGNDNTKIIGRGSVKYSWAQGRDSNTVYSAGGTITHNIFRDENTGSELDVNAGYDKTFVGRYRSGQYTAGLTYRFPG